MGRRRSEREVEHKGEGVGVALRIRHKIPKESFGEVELHRGLFAKNCHSRLRERQFYQSTLS